MTTKATRHRFYYLTCPNTGELSWFHSAMRPTDKWSSPYTGVTVARPSNTHLQFFSPDPASNLQVLAHDALEHDATIKNIGVQELSALGAIAAHRYADSILESEIWDVVRFMLESDTLPKNVRLSNSSNPVIEQELANWWAHGYHYLWLPTVEHDDLEVVWPTVKRVVRKAFCSGYNSVDDSFPELFCNFKHALHRAFEELNKYNYGEGTSITLNIKDLSNFQFSVK